MRPSRLMKDAIQGSEGRGLQPASASPCRRSAGKLLKMLGHALRAGLRSRPSERATTFY